MKSIIRENRLYFIYIACFALFGGIALLTMGKPDAIIFFSENRMDWADFFFRLITHLGESPGYIIAGVIAFFYLRELILPIVATGLAAMGLSYVLKIIFAIDRPLTYFRKANIVDEINFVAGVKLYTGPNSFPSGHSLGAFALFSLLAFFLPKRSGYVTAMFFLAISVGVSRVYLVQHFWQDVYAGSLVGVVLAMAVFSLNQRYNGGGSSIPGAMP